MAPNLIYLLEDQLDASSPLLARADRPGDVFVMAELEAEARRLPFHKQRLALVFAAMRHARDELRERGFDVRYQQLDDDGAHRDHRSFLTAQISAVGPERVVVVRPGDHRVLGEIRAAADAARVPLDLREDPHFLVTPAEFAAWADGRSRLTMEYFYREQRRRHGVLMAGDEPEGGAWNFDQDNRESFGGDGPGEIKDPVHFRPDAVTRGVLDMVAGRFSDNPGTLDGFDHPVTHDEALRAVRDFVEHRLPRFGDHQDAMWTGRPYLFHSRISAAMNLHLVDPRHVIARVEDAYEAGDVPINAAEGFIRQVLGWREYVRGVYWLHMPDYAERNALDARRDLPDCYWTGQTDMACVHQVVTQLRDTAYAHHIQRLMVMGLFAMLYGVRPQAVHDWHMAMYADAWEWVSLPNTIGMSQYADGGVVGTKPYAASGRYIDRMSNYCDGCRYDPGDATGQDACPFTTLYWDFLIRHEDRLADNRRMNFQMANVARKGPPEREAIRQRARTIREGRG